MWALLQLTGSVALGVCSLSSQPGLGLVRDLGSLPRIGKWGRHHWPTREVLATFYKSHPQADTHSFIYSVLSWNLQFCSCKPMLFSKLPLSLLIYIFDGCNIFSSSWSLLQVTLFLVLNYVLGPHSQEQGYRAKEYKEVLKPRSLPQPCTWLMVKAQ